MTLQQLEYIIALDKYRHYVKASEACYISQPNLTMQIKKLEEEIGLKIFDRESKPIKPTEMGEQILARARQILSDVDEMKDFVSGNKNSLTGEYTLGIIPTIAPYLLPIWLPKFIAENKDTKLIIKEMQTSEIIRDLKNGKIDLGILATPLSEKNIRETPIYNEPFLLYINKNDPLSSQKSIESGDVDSENLLILDEGHCFRDQTLKICKDLPKNRNRNFELSSGSIEALIGLVEQGLGYTLIPKLATYARQFIGEIRNFSNEVPVREVSVVTSNNFSKEKLIDTIHDSITEIIPESFNRIRKYFRVEWK